MNSSGRTRTAAGLAILIAMIAVQTVFASPAHACSCAPGPPVAPIDGLDAAFVGVASEFIGHARVEGGDFTIIRFEVQEVVKGQFETGDDAFLLVKEFGDSCGYPQFTPGDRMFRQRAGIQISDAERPVVREVCTSTDPSYVLDAVPGLDAPTSDGPVDRFILGEWRNTVMRLLDENNNVVRYVEANGNEVGPSLCPDGITLATITDGPAVRWRNLETLEIIAESPLPGEAGLVEQYGRSALVADRCVGDNRVLVRGQDTLWIADPGVAARTVPYGEYESGSLNADGTWFADWNTLFDFEIRATNGGAPTTVGTISNHTGRFIEVSPDGTRVAFIRRQPPLTRIDMEVVIADRAGNEIFAILDPLFANGGGPRWLDDQTLINGTARIDLGGPTPNVVDMRIPGDDVQAGGPTERIVTYVEGEGEVVLDLRSGERSPWIASDTRLYGFAYPLRQTVEVTAPGFVPAPRPVRPLPGGAVLPATPAALTALIVATPDSEVDPFLRQYLPDFSPSLGEVLMSSLRRRIEWRTRTGFQ